MLNQGLLRTTDTDLEVRDQRLGQRRSGPIDPCGKRWKPRMVASRRGYNGWGGAARTISPSPLPIALPRQRPIPPRRPPRHPDPGCQVRVKPKPPAPWASSVSTDGGERVYTPSQSTLSGRAIKWRQVCNSPQSSVGGHALQGRRFYDPICNPEACLQAAPIYTSKGNLFTWGAHSVNKYREQL